MSFFTPAFRILAVAAGIFISASLPAQFSGKEIKAVEKSKKYYNEGKYDKAVTTLDPVLKAHETTAELWLLMVPYKAARYETQKNKEMNEMLAALMSGLKKGKNITINMNTALSGQYMTEYLSACKRATLCADQQENASIILRNVYIDEVVDTGVSKEAKDKFGEAEQEFQAKNYAKAVKLYQDALNLDTNYYKAGLYLGDSYWNDKQSEQALKYFKRAIAQKPAMLEPRKYLVDAYISMQQYELAYNECVNAILVHPDIGMFIKLDKICKLRGKTLERHWMSRLYYTNDPQVLQEPVNEEPWKYYREAKEKIMPYCNSDGIIEKTNTLTKAKYMEAYCWEYMLEKAEPNDERFAFARKMQKAGQLDCFVLVSMYHINLNPQFAHLAKNSPDKIRDYFTHYLVQ